MATLCGSLLSEIPQLSKLTCVGLTEKRLAWTQGFGYSKLVNPMESK